MSPRGSHQVKIHEVRSVPNAASRFVAPEVTRANDFRTRAIALAEAARREDDKGQRRFLLDKARSLISVADAMDPPPAEPPVFSK